MKNFVFFSGTFACCFVSSCIQNSHSFQNPNVLLILTDDQGWGDFGFNGNMDVRTPFLDSLSHVSAHFTNFYVSPLSATTRAGLLTGRDHLRTGALCVTRASENMDADELTMAEIFQNENYVTGCFGKWHNGAHFPQDPNGQGFDEFYGFCSGHLTNYFDSNLQHNHQYVKANGYITDVLTDKAIEFIRQQVSKEQKNPFFCYVPYNAPHAPYQVPDEFYDHYVHLQKDSLDTTPAVYAMCENLDFNIRRLFEELKNNNTLNNTIVIFMTDNGPNDFRYNGNLSGKKGQLKEGGIKVPCLVYWKDKIIPVKLEETTSYIDILPTIMDLCGFKDYASKERPLNGVSLEPLLLQNQNNIQEKKDLEKELNSRYLFTHRSTSDFDLFPNEGLIFNSEYKFMIHKNGDFSLYNKKKDLSESVNIAHSNKTICDKMSRLYDQWYKDVSVEYLKRNSRMTKIGLLDIEQLIPAHEACKSGKVKYYTNEHGWAGDWLTNIYQSDSIYWELDVMESGNYKVSLQYALASDFPNVKLCGHGVNSNSYTEIVSVPTFNSIRLDSPDRVKRVEAYEQTWNNCSLGNIYFRKGKEKFILKFKGNNIFLEGLQIKGILIQKISCM